MLKRLNSRVADNSEEKRQKLQDALELGSRRGSRVAFAATLGIILVPMTFSTWNLSSDNKEKMAILFVAQTIMVLLIQYANKKFLSEAERKKLERISTFNSDEISATLEQKGKYSIPRCLVGGTIAADTIAMSIILVDEVLISSQHKMLNTLLLIYISLTYVVDIALYASRKFLPETVREELKLKYDVGVMNNRT